jgi:uncharacterized protein YkwD
MKKSYKENTIEMKNLNKKIKYIPAFLLAFALLFTLTAKAFASEINDENVFKQLNQERTARGLQALKENNDLTNAARLKSKDMVNRDYFEHYAFGLAPWDFMSISGYDYLYAGENLAMDFATSEGMVKAWMNSPAHKENILNPDFKEIGIGVVKGAYTEKNLTHESTVVTTMFGTEKPRFLKIIDHLIKLLFPFR